MKFVLVQTPDELHNFTCRCNATILDAFLKACMLVLECENVMQEIFYTWNVSIHQVLELITFHNLFRVGLGFSPLYNERMWCALWQ